MIHKVTTSLLFVVVGCVFVCLYVFDNYLTY